MHAARLVLPLLIGCAAIAAAAPVAIAAYPGVNGAIAFTTDPANEDQEIAVLPAGGGAVTALTSNSADDRTPTYSPDGTRIAFVSLRDGNEEIYVMNADGSGQTRLTDNPLPDRDPTWSPGGERIAFSSYRNANIDIYAMNADGSCADVRLTDHIDPDDDPAWSPDGTTIAFEAVRDGNKDIWAMDADGSDERNLSATDPGVSSSDPSWSPDSAAIAFTRAEGDTDAYTMAADGTGQTNRTDHGAPDTAPTFSADGTQLAWSTSRDGNAEIYTGPASATTAGGTRMTNDLALDAQPDWQAVPDAGDPVPADAPYSCTAPPADEPGKDDVAPITRETPPGGEAGTGIVTTVATPLAVAVALPKQRLRQALAKGLVVRGGCARACRVAGRLVLSGRLAKRLRLSKKARPVTVARGAATAPAGAKAAVRLKFTKAAKRRLARKRSVELKLVLTPSDAGGAGTAAVRSITLRR